jgi:hypothetical protein
MLDTVARDGGSLRDGAQSMGDTLGDLLADVIEKMSRVPTDLCVERWFRLRNSLQDIQDQHAIDGLSMEDMLLVLGACAMGE